MSMRIESNMGEQVTLATWTDIGVAIDRAIEFMARWHFEAPDRRDLIARPSD